MQSRAVAALVLTEILTRRLSLSVVLPDFLNQVSLGKDRSFIQELCYGVLRWYYQLDFILQAMLDKDLKSKDTDIKVLILIGLYQLEFLRTPEHAAVSATVEACTDLKKHWAKKLVNALLRRYQKENTTFKSLLEKEDQARYSHPRWLIEIIDKEYPDRWQDVVRENNRHPPMFLRVNTRLTSRNDYMRELDKNNINATETPFVEAGIKLAKPVDVGQLPFFNDGHVSVQDLAAQLCFSLMDIQQNHRVLDACAAPGGKLAHILEQCPEHIDVTALEPDETRFERMQKNLDRLRLKATLICNAAEETDRWWDNNSFDRILVDAPCSATGVIRRHPDIKILRVAENIAASAEIQGILLSSLWSLLKHGGKLLYVTCSILSTENDQCIRAFLERHNDAKCIRLHTEWGKDTEFGKQILPGEHDMDGFYYASLEKI